MEQATKPTGPPPEPEKINLILTARAARILRDRKRDMGAPFGFTASKAIEEKADRESKG